MLLRSATDIFSLLEQKQETKAIGLLEENSPLSKNSEGKTALMVAVEAKCWGFVRYCAVTLLLKAPDEYGIALIRALLDPGFSDTGLLSILIRDAQASLTAYDPTTGYAAIHAAISVNDEKSVELLLNHERKNIGWFSKPILPILKTKTKEPKSPLKLAIEENRPSIVKLLLDTDRYSLTEIRALMHEAAAHNRWGCVREFLKYCLIKKIPFINTKLVDAVLFMDALDQDQHEIVALMIEGLQQQPKLLNQAMSVMHPKTGLFPLHVAAMKQNKQAFDFLLETRALGPALDGHFTQVLEIVIKMDRSDFINSLLPFYDAGIPYLTIASVGLSPLAYAAKLKHPHCVRELLDHRAKKFTPPNIYDALLFAKQNNDQSSMDHLVTYAKKMNLQTLIDKVISDEKAVAARLIKSEIEFEAECDQDEVVNIFSKKSYSGVSCSFRLLIDSWSRNQRSWGLTDITKYLTKQPNALPKVAYFASIFFDESSPIEVAFKNVNEEAEEWMAKAMLEVFFRKWSNNGTSYQPISTLITILRGAYSVFPEIKDEHEDKEVLISLQTKTFDELLKSVQLHIPKELLQGERMQVNFNNAVLLRMAAILYIQNLMSKNMFHDKKIRWMLERVFGQKIDPILKEWIERTFTSHDVDQTERDVTCSVVKLSIFFPDRIEAVSLNSDGPLHTPMLDRMRLLP